MSSTKLSGLSADAGSGSDHDDEARPSTRSVVVAIEKTDDGLSAVKFAAENVLKGEVRGEREDHPERRSQEQSTGRREEKEEAREGGISLSFFL